LIVTGKPSHLDQIGAILKQLGAGAAKPEGRETRIFELSTASAVELAANASSCPIAPRADRPNRATRASGTHPLDRVTARDRVATRTLSKLSRRPVVFA